MEKGEGKREIRRMNRTRIARLISKAGTVSKNEISVRLGLSMPTVLQSVRELEEEGIVAEAGEYGSTGGRKAKQMSIAEDAAYGAGMDVAKGHIDFVIVNLKGELMKKARIRLPFTRDFSSSTTRIFMQCSHCMLSRGFFSFFSVFRQFPC